MASEMQAFNEKIIAEFRANEGRVEMFADYPMIILHTIGRKSGNTILVPLVLTYRNDEMLLFASFAGSKEDPLWAHNLRANPKIEVEVGTEKFTVVVEELAPDEAAAERDITAAESEVFAGYVSSAAPRIIPVFRLNRQ